MSAGTTQEEIVRLMYGFCIQAEKELFPEYTKEPKKIIVIAGPTAAGKTELSLLLARTVGGEIISSDSMQVYRGMDIGTAKATPEQQAAIPHHLVDIRDIHEPFNVVDFYYEACSAIDNIFSRDRVPVVTGGSGFYIHSLLYGPPSGPPSVPEVRNALEEEAEREGIALLYKRLLELDPVYASTIMCHDKQKIVRALEIMQLTKQKVSELPWRAREQPVNFDFRCWFIHRPKEKLHERIDRRCDQMLENGLLAEVAELEKRGLRGNHAASQAIGYRQSLEYLDGPQTQERYAAFVNQFKAATRQYVKRQFTWFRKEPLFRWIDIDMHDPETAIDMILTDYYTPPGYEKKG